MRTVFLMMIFASVSANADGQAEYKYREGVMQAIRGQIASIGVIARGQVYQENLAMHARGMSDLAQVLPHVFPEGSDVGKSEALPAVWNDPEGFSIQTDLFIEVTGAFLEAAENNGDVSGTLRRVQRSCKSCHDGFRED